ncbi:hypothetical protein D3C72_1819600 [compost metagenome]
MTNDGNRLQVLVALQFRNHAVQRCVAGSDHGLVEGEQAGSRQGEGLDLGNHGRSRSNWRYSNRLRSFLVAALNQAVSCLVEVAVFPAFAVGVASHVVQHAVSRVASLGSESAAGQHHGNNQCAQFDRFIHSISSLLDKSTSFAKLLMTSTARQALRQTRNSSVAR